MRNLNKRIFRSLKTQWSKNLLLFILMCSMISITSGMLVASGSIKTIYYELMSKGIVEDGKLLFAFNPTDEIIKSIEDENVKVEKEKEEEGEETGQRSKIDIERRRGDRSTNWELGDKLNLLAAVSGVGAWTFSKLHKSLHL